MIPNDTSTIPSLKSCEVCRATYAPYKTGKDEDVGIFWTVIDHGTDVKGVCQFHNPESKLFVC